jgi:hypothetical protein
MYCVLSQPSVRWTKKNFGDSDTDVGPQDVLTTLEKQVNASRDVIAMKCVLLIGVLMKLMEGPVCEKKVEDELPYAVKLRKHKHDRQVHELNTLGGR